MKWQLEIINQKICSLCVREGPGGESLLIRISQTKVFMMASKTTTQYDCNYSSIDIKGVVNCVRIAGHICTHKSPR